MCLRRVHIDDPAAHRELATSFHAIGPVIAETDEVAHQILEIDPIARRYTHRRG